MKPEEILALAEKFDLGYVGVDGEFYSDEQRATAPLLLFAAEVISLTVECYCARMQRERAINKEISK